jgi:hypothetical protein
LQNNPNFTAKLHLKFQVKKNLLVELCVGNYSTHDVLVSGVDGIFQASSNLPNSQVIWILFNNPKNGPSNDVSLELLKHIGLTTNRCILHSNFHIMFHNTIT